LWCGQDCHIVKCEDCEFAFSVPFTAGDAEFYELVSPNTNYPGRKWEFDRTIHALRTLDVTLMNIIEIGAGNGMFLRMLRNEGCPSERLFATEFSSAGRAAIERLGIRCTDRDVRRFESECKFDVVCMFQVLEHLDDYCGLFKALDRLTSPGSHLFVAVPYGEWIFRNEMHGLLLDVPPNHISRWWPRSFECLAARFDWTLERCELEPPSLLQDITESVASRFLRKSQDETSWENLTSRLAARMKIPSVSKAIKLSGAITSLSCWKAAFGPLVDGPVSHSVWAQLRRPTPLT
jgi:SAM-dependent methyltransferase